MHVPGVQDTGLPLSEMKGLVLLVAPDLASAGAGLVLHAPPRDSQPQPAEGSSCSRLSLVVRDL